MNIRMIDYKEFFGVKYPIIAAAMNQVSEINLAIACYQAGILPSLSIYMFYRNGELNLAKFKESIEVYKTKTGSCKLILSCGTDDIFNQEVIKIIIDNKLTHIELIEGLVKRPLNILRDQLKFLRENEIKSSIKALDLDPFDYSMFDFITTKGIEAAGRSRNGVTVEENFNNFKKEFPNTVIVPSGGIGSSQQIKYFLEKGATAVSIGTLIAACKESIISVDTKLKMINSSKNDIQKLKCQLGEDQKGLIFKPIEKDSINNTISLYHGVRGTEKGHIFAGDAIDQITEIKPIEEIIQNLVKDL